MDLSTTEALKSTFLACARDGLARSLRLPEDWTRYAQIVHETDARIKAEQAAHAWDYQTRIAEAKEIILREENGIRLDQPLPPGVEAHSDKDTLQSKAETRVRQDYDRRIAAIQIDEYDQYTALTNEIRQRDGPSRASSQTQSQDRGRSGPSRT